MDTSSLMEQILSSDNLNRAYLQVVRNKGAEGVDGMKYTELKEHLAKNGEIIKEQLKTRKYKPQPVRRVEIPKPDGGVRNLGVPTVTDRFIQQAIAQVLTPIYEEQFHDHSYGFRPNRCAQQAVITALEMMNDGNDWIVDIDLEKFFDTVNHDKLMTLIGRTIKDGDVISIVRKYLVSGIMIDDEYEDSIVGTPQGGNLSPLLANIMLKELDSNIRYRLRMCIWKHWKTPQNRAKNLMKLGLPKWAARRTAYINGYARVCRTWDIHQAISNERLTSFGLVSMLDYYTERCVTC